MSWTIGIIFALFIIAYLLLAPVLLEIDTAAGLFRFRFHRLASATLDHREGLLFVDVKLAVWQWRYDLLMIGKREDKVKKKAAAKRGGTFSSKTIGKKAWGIIESCRINKCRMMFDTGNMPLNGILYPWFYLLSSRTGRTVLIDFWGEDSIALEIENSIARMLWAYIKS